MVVFVACFVIIQWYSQVLILIQAQYISISKLSIEITCYAITTYESLKILITFKCLEYCEAVITSVFTLDIYAVSSKNNA